MGSVMQVSTPKYTSDAQRISATSAAAAQSSVLQLERASAACCRSGPAGSDSCKLSLHLQVEPHSFSTLFNSIQNPF